MFALIHLGEVEDIHELGRKIQERNVFGHMLSVHNEPGEDVFVDAEWVDYGILQGPKTLRRSTLSRIVLENHHPEKPLYAQETLWPGNGSHPEYSADDVRKNAYVLIMSGTAINFGDMDGNSCSGFTGNLDLSCRNQELHDAIAVE